MINRTRSQLKGRSAFTWPTILLLGLLMTGWLTVVIAPSASATTAPAVSGVSPSSGSTHGGTRVTITGAQFTHVSAVLFGTVRGTSIHLVSSTKLLVTAPPHSPGRVNIRIHTPAGTSAIQARDYFTYVRPPAVSSVSPPSGTTSGGTRITITGNYFLHVLKVTVGGTLATHLTVQSGSSLSVTTPIHAAGATDVRVITAYGTSSIVAGDKFDYMLPTSLTWSAPTNVGTNPASAPQFATEVYSVSCTPTGFCAAVGTAIFQQENFNRYPAVIYRINGAWTGPYLVNTMTSLTSVSCMSASFCIAVGQTATNSGFVSAYVNLNSNTLENWAPTVLDTIHNLTAVSCSNGPFCLAVDDGGNFLTYAGGKWSALKNSNTNAPFQNVSCVSSAFCLAATPGAVYGYNGTSWATSNLQGATSLSCVSTDFCMTTTPNGESWFNGATWSTPQPDGVFVGSVSCSGTSFCVDVSNGKYSMFNGDGWSQTMALPAFAQGQEISSASCILVTRCVAVGGDVLLDSQ